MEKMVFKAHAYAQYKRTVAQHPAETGSILVGRPDDPFVVRECRFCPPARRDDGSYNMGTTRFGIDADYINWAIDHEWGPNGLYVIGFLHSHPGGMSRLSGGDMKGVAGDIPLLTACLEAPQMKAAGIDQLLAPIATFHADGSDQLHGWMLRRGSHKPEKIDIVVEGADKAEASAPIPEPVTNEEADMIDSLVLRRRALLNRSELGFFDKVLARRLYAKAVASVLPDQVDRKP